MSRSLNGLAQKLDIVVKLAEDHTWEEQVYENCKYESSVWVLYKIAEYKSLCYSTNSIILTRTHYSSYINNYCK